MNKAKVNSIDSNVKMTVHFGKNNSKNVMEQVKKMLVISHISSQNKQLKA